MKPTDILKAEHQAILEMLDVIDAVCTKLTSGEAVNPDHLDQVVNFIKGFADSCHHAKEENVLFKAMEDAGMPKEGGPIGVMLMEHNVGRQHVKAMSEAVAGYRLSEKQARQLFIEHARAYVQLLRQHILKEDNILFPMADRHLSDTQQQTVLDDFKHVEHHDLGSGSHEKYLGILATLKKHYLG
ncbi:MAG TPA: hemerythrin domain-containing protein [Candidatus Deferrimicrobium sp.]|nr:hemerythrin domain-containing protein [Candidatus Deferrimicrobium sp.]